MEQAIARRKRAKARLGDDGSPFAGLAAFQEGDASRFFGRDRDVEHITGELRSRPLVAIVGPSGAGKSSLVRAGVIPALKRSGEGWDSYVVRPGRTPLAALAAILAQMQATSSLIEHVDDAAGEPGVLMGRLAAEPDPEAACERLVAQANSAGGRDNITAIVAHFEAA